MKRMNGFTLIELLAVIVILAIIAVIAVPIVLNIIDEAKQSSVLRSADFYLRAAELSISQATLKEQNISDGVYKILGNGNICLEYKVDNETCEKELMVEVNGEVPEIGSITITNGNITGLNIFLNKKEIYINSKGELVYAKLLDEVCELKNGIAKTVGAKYECNVDPNKDSYTFYVLNTRNKAGEIITQTSTDKEALSINLIMAQNINSDGTPTTKAIGEFYRDTNGGVYNLVPWISEKDYGTLHPYDGDNCNSASGCVLNDKGPLTIMNFLQEATKNWTNTNEMIVDTFTDNVGATHNMKTYNTYARIPYLSEISSYDSTTKTNAYLYDYLKLSNNIQTNKIDDIYGYWTLTSSATISRFAWFVYYNGVVDSSDVRYDGYRGVRAVINLKI